MEIIPLNAIDFYKSSHRSQYPEGTELIYSNFTPRGDSHAHPLAQGCIVNFGVEMMIQDYISDCWNRGFFEKSKDEVIKNYTRRMDNSLGAGAVPTDHVEHLHDLGYLPLHIKALPEGIYVPLRTPVLTIRNTVKEAFWLTNYLESAISAYLWKPMTTATIAYAYRDILEKWAIITGGDLGFVPLQGHDFSFRGMSGLHDAAISGVGHLVSFRGTDSVLAIDAAEKFYEAAPSCGVSVPATEHSVMCAGGRETEIDTFRRLINKVHPTGIVSIVSDTWDFWKVLTEYLPELKQEILDRDGKVVIRPDSGNPADIVCGDPSAPEGSPEYKGAIEVLWDLFGGQVNSGGFFELHEKIGLIYGERITLDMAEEICRRLCEKQFCSTNLVFGIGSYTYQYVTRDTYGLAMKATYSEANGAAEELYKDPATDNGVKKSAKGLLRVNEDMSLTDQVSWEEEETGMLESVFLDGKITRFTAFEEIQQRLHGDILPF